MREIEFRRLQKENAQLKEELHRLHQTDRSQLPETNITVLFTDIEGSTPLWEYNSAAMKQSLVLHNNLIRSVVAECQGFETATEGGKEAKRKK
jgi:class 3 adenylate cyclase